VRFVREDLKRIMATRGCVVRYAVNRVETSLLKDGTKTTQSITKNIEENIGGG